MVIKTLQNKYLMALVLFATIFASCKNQFDKHDAVSNSALTTNLMEQINQNSNLSKFSQYLVQTGYDKIISSSKTYTVWAPTNAAFQSVDPAILSDTAKLRLFIGNHISNQSYTTTMAGAGLRIKMLNGKNTTFTTTTFETARIVQGNQYVANGILHVIDAAIIPKLNIWDYVNSLTTAGLLQKAYLVSQNYTYQDTSLATVTGVGANGKPILKPGTGIVNKNHYLDQTQNLQNEDGQFTYIVLTDAAYTSETNKVLKYFATSTTDSTANLAAFNVTKDLILPGVIAQANLPDTALSTNNVKVPVLKGANIVQTYNASNGIVYVMSSVNYRLVDKITPIVIQGENPSYFPTSTQVPNFKYRLRVDPNGVPYKDLFIESITGTTLPAAYYAGYKVNGAYSVSYRVYERAINEQISTATATTQAAPIIFSQTLNIYSPYNPVTTFGPLAVAYLNYNEVPLGTYTLSRYGYINITNVGANNTTAGMNSTSLDYLKLVPILP